MDVTQKGSNSKQTPKKARQQGLFPAVIFIIWPAHSPWYPPPAALTAAVADSHLLLVAVSAEFSAVVDDSIKERVFLAASTAGKGFMFLHLDYLHKMKMPEAADRSGVTANAAIHGDNIGLNLCEVTTWVLSRTVSAIYASTALTGMLHRVSTLKALIFPVRRSR